MPRGGARNRSGPAADPLSERSERRSYTLTALPREGFRGEIPEWPLFVSEDDGGLHGIEVAIWEEAWRSPQACAWSMEGPAVWRIVAEMCRVAALVETDPSASASLITQLHRYRDQVGLTKAGMNLNGWAVASGKAPIEAVPDVPEGVPQQRRRSREMSA